MAVNMLFSSRVSRGPSQWAHRGIFSVSFLAIDCFIACATLFVGGLCRSGSRRSKTDRYRADQSFPSFPLYFSLLA